VHPLAVQVTAELGVDIQSHGVHQVTDDVGWPFDDAITVCDSAAEECPFFLRFVATFTQRFFGSK
jgi:arsenate reductase